MPKNFFTNKNNYSELTKELILLAEIEGAQSTCLDVIEKLSSKFQVKIVSSIAKLNSLN